MGKAQKYSQSLLIVYLVLVSAINILYIVLFGYKMEVLLSSKESKKSRSSLLQDGSRFLGLFWKRKTYLMALLHTTDCIFEVLCGREKPIL